MKKSELLGEIKKLNAIYAQTPNETIGQIWWEQFKDCDYTMFAEAVKEYMASGVYFPKPAEIWKHYHEQEQKREHNKYDLWIQYNSLCSRYPGGAKADDDCKREFFRITGWDIDKAKMLVRHAEMAVKEMENGKGYIPLIEYLRELK